MGEVVVSEGPFKDLSIFFVHLSPALEDDRLLEVQDLFKNVEKTSEAIIMGDLNSLSPHDPYDHQSLLKIFKNNNVIKYGTETLRFDVIKKIESFGLIDAATFIKYAFTSSTPTSSNKDMNHAANLRIDYAFLKNNLTQYLTKIEVVKNKNTELASDHYPLFIELHK